MKLYKPGQRTPPKVREKIRELHDAGKSTTDISRSTGVAYGTAKHWVEAPICRIIFPAEEVLALLRKRMGHKQIAKTVGVPFRSVQKFARANGFRGPGPRWHPSTMQLTELIDLTFAGQDSVSSICRKINGPYGPVNRLVHRVRKCSAFLTSQVLDFLSANGAPGTEARHEHLPASTRGAGAAWDSGFGQTCML